MPKWTVLIKAGLYYKPTLLSVTWKHGSKVKENLLHRKNRQYVRNILVRRDSNSNRTSWENGKQKKLKKPASQVMSWSKWSYRWSLVCCPEYPNVHWFRWSYGNRSKPTPLLKKKSAVSLLSMVKLFKSLIWCHGRRYSSYHRRCLHRLYW